MNGPEVARLKERERENARLKKIVVEQALARARKRGRFGFLPGDASNAGSIPLLQ